MDATTFLERMAQGDPSVFRELMPELRRLTRGACFRYRIAEDRREDLVQEVALRVFRNWRKFRGDCQLSTWIYTIARNQCLDALNHDAGAPDFVVPGDDDPGDTIDHGTSDHDQSRCVQSVLAELDREGPARDGSMRKADVLDFCVLQSPSTEELAQFLKTTVAAAKERKRYLWAHLKRLCAKHCGTDECGLETGVQG